MQLGFSVTILYHTLVYFLKISILVSVRRLYKVDIKQNRYAGWIFNAYIVLYTCVTLAFILIIFNQCTPRAAGWSLRTYLSPGTRCPGRAQTGIASSIVLAAFDIILLLLPMYKIYYLWVPGTTKFGIMFILSLGSVTCAMSVWKAVVVTASTSRKDVTCKILKSSCCSTANYVQGIPTGPSWQRFWKPIWVSSPARSQP
jgi:hypothetical protein